MKKIKFLIAGLFSAIALVFACVVGTRVNAAITDGIYTWLPENSGTYSGSIPSDYSIFSFNVNNNKYTLQNAGTLDSKMVPTNTYTGSTWTKEALVTGGNRTVSINLAANQTASATIYLYTTGERVVTIGSDQTNLNKEFKVVTGTLDSTHNVMTFSNNKLAILEIVVEVTTSSKTNEELAAESISAIGTVAYTAESKNLIDTAAAKVNACTDPTKISNYATYTSAVDTFNSLRTSAISAFTTAVANIGTVTSTSGEAIETAKTAYSVLFGDALTETSVVTAKTSLDSKTYDYKVVMWDINSKKTPAFSSLSSQDNITESFDLTGTIFSVICNDSSKVQIINDRTSEGYTGSISTKGKSSFDNGKEARVFSFMTKSSGVLRVVAQAGGTSDTRKVEVYSVGATTNTSVGNVTTTTTTTEYSIDIPSAGDYIVGASGNAIHFYELEFIPETPLSTNTTAAVFAEKNTAGDTLRFVGTLTGITALANIDKIELFLKKDGVAAANPIELTTCYTSVINTSQTCAEANNTYYVIFRLTGIDSLAAGTKISKQLKVTFTDGSSTISDVTEITL